MTNKKTNKRQEFFKLLENKFFDLGEKFLKKGVASLAISQINKTEEKIKAELEEKYKKYQKKILKSLFLIIAASFLFYGILSLIMFKLELAEYTNILFGIIFLALYFIFSIK